MKGFWLIVGYLVGLGCLLMVSAQTFLAVFNPSKAITIFVNNYGESSWDVIALIVLWVIMIIGLFVLLRNRRNQSTLQMSESLIGIAGEPRMLCGYDGEEAGVIMDFWTTNQSTSPMMMVQPLEGQLKDFPSDENGCIVTTLDSLLLLGFQIK